LRGRVFYICGMRITFGNREFWWGVIVSSLILSVPPACTAMQRAKVAERLRPSCEAAIIASPDLQDRADRLEVTIEEYARAVCALPGVAAALAAGKPAVTP